MSNTAAIAETIEGLIIEAVQNARTAGYIYGCSRTIEQGFVRVIRVPHGGLSGKEHWRATFNTPDDKRTSRAKFAQAMQEAH
jgi:hypothetical protein